MAALNSDLIKDTENLVTLYNKSPILRKIILQNLNKSRVTFKGRPLKTYLYVITQTVSPEFAGKYKSERGYKSLVASLGTENDFFVRLFHKVSEFNRLNKAYEKLTEEERRELKELDRVEDEQARYRAFEKHVEKKQVEQGSRDEDLGTGKNNVTLASRDSISPSVLQNDSTPVTSDQQLVTRINPEKILEAAKNGLNSNLTKNLASQTLISAKKFASKHLNLSVGTFFAGVGAIAGFSYGGLVGAVAGGALGGSFSAILARSSGEGVTRIIEVMPQKGGVYRTPSIATRRGGYVSPNTLQALRLAANFTPVGRGVKILKYAIPAMIILILVVISPGGLDFLNSVAPLSPYDVAESAGLPGGSSGGGGDVASCTFYRSGDGQGISEGGLKFNISEWPILISEIAGKSGVPSSILAAFLRVECPDCFATKNPDYIKNDYDPHANGLVYGAVQFYPPTFENVFNLNRAELQSKFGKTSVKTTIDPQDSMAPGNVFRIYSIRDSLTAAAYKVKAASGGVYDRSGIEKAVKDYFTQCTYAQGGNTYSYCDDVYKSYVQCKASQPKASPAPTLPPGADYRAQILQRFNIAFLSEQFTRKELKWAWDALNEATLKEPGFLDRIREQLSTRTTKNVEVVATDHTETHNNSYKITIHFRDDSGGPFSSENLFKQVLIHELGHVVHGPANASCGGIDTGLCQARSLDPGGYLTRYSQDGSDEEFAETISYYLLDSLPSEQPTVYLDLKWPSIHPLRTGEYPKHIEYIQKVLRGLVR